MAKITGKMMHNSYCVEPKLAGSADFVVSIYSWDKLDYIGEGVY